MYHPQENNYSGDKIEVEIEKVQIQTTDNISLLGWFHKKDLPKIPPPPSLSNKLIQHVIDSLI